MTDTEGGRSQEQTDSPYDDGLSADDLSWLRNARAVALLPEGTFELHRDSQPPRRLRKRETLVRAKIAGRKASITAGPRKAP